MLRFFRAPKATVRVISRYCSAKSEPPSETDQKEAAKRLSDFFKKAEEQIAKEQVEAQSRPTELPVDDKPEESDTSNTSQDSVSDTKRTKASAQCFVPWTMNRLLQPMNISRLSSKRSSAPEPSFASLLRQSTFVQLGNFDGREVIGVVIENVNDTDLYIDFGGKFHCVCPQPANQYYPRGSLVRVRLRDPEMTNQFMINTKAITLREADATFIGPYRGRLTRSAVEESSVPVVIGDAQGQSRPATDADSVSLENWRLL